MDEESVEREVTERDKNGKIGMGHPRESNIWNPKVGGLDIDVSKASVKLSLPCPSNAFISVWQFAFASTSDSVMLLSTLGSILMAKFHRRIVFQNWQSWECQL